jgi:hypothetical protein
MLVSSHQYGADEYCDVDWMQELFLLMRAGLWQALTDLDERYFMYVGR